MQGLPFGRQRLLRIRKPSWEGKGEAMKHDRSALISARVLVVDDHEIVRSAVTTFLMSEGFTIVGQAVSGEDAIRLATATQPDIVIMDVRMPGMGGIRATRDLRAVSPKSQVVGWSVTADRDTVLSMMEAGACAFVPKGERDQLIAVLRRIARELQKPGKQECEEATGEPHSSPGTGSVTDAMRP